MDASNARAESERDLKAIARLFEEISQMHRNTKARLEEASARLEAIRKSVDHTVGGDVSTVDHGTEEFKAMPINKKTFLRTSIGDSRPRKVN